MSHYFTSTSRSEMVNKVNITFTSTVCFMNSDVLLKAYSGIQPVRQYTNENIVLNVKLLLLQKI